MKRRDFSGKPEIAKKRAPFMVQRIVFCFFFLILASATVSAQAPSFTFNVENKKIIDLLQEIEETSSYRFFYQNEQINVKRKVSVSVRDASINQVLDKIFAGANVNYRMLEDDLFILSRGEPTSGSEGQTKQRISIRGLVTDEKGEPLPGVTIIIRGTIQGTITNRVGRYSITNITDDATLQFSFVGMIEREIAVANRSTINVTMTMDVIGLEEVIAVGYGTQERQDVSAAISKIKSRQIEKRVLSNLDEAMVGQMSGIRFQQASGVPGQKSLITIRGRNSIGNSSEPLYVVDGIAIDDLNRINMFDVESVQVLKDAASVSIYGARGANGVILVTTKSGTSGAPKISFDATMGIQEPEKMYQMMNKPEFYDYINRYWESSWYRSGGDPDVPWEDRPSHKRVPDYIHNTPYADLPDTDWMDAMFERALKQSYQISVRGGTDRTTYFVSARYLDQDGIFINTHHNHLTFRAKVESKISDWLTAGVNIAPSYNTSNNYKTENKNWTMQWAMLNNPLMPLGANTYDTEFYYWNGVNPYLQQKEKIDEDRSNSLLTNLFADIELFNEINLRTAYGLTTADGNSKFFEQGRFNNNKQNGFYNTFSHLKHQIDNTLTFQRLVTNSSINVLLGQSAQYEKFWNSQQSSAGFPNDYVYTLNVASTPTKSSTSELETTLSSWFGRVQYEYANKYLFTVNARYDGSSRFGSNKKWGFFPSASLGWKISEESFLKNAEWISFLKLRASYGKAGNDAIGDYRWSSNLSSANYNFNGQLVNGYVPSNYGNKDLRWETLISRNIGIDLWILNNRFKFIVDVYSNDSKDILMNVPLPSQTGFTSYTANYGKVNNRGIESEISGYVFKGKFKWESSFNISWNKNEVVDILDPFNQNFYGIYSRMEVGYPIRGFYMYQWDGLVTQEDLDNGYNLPGSLVGGIKYKDQNGDKAITTDDITHAGSPFPKFIYGWSNNFSYGNFDLSVLLQAQSGGNVLFMAARQNDNGGTSNSFKHWTKNYRSEEDPGDGRYPIFGSKTLRHSDHDLYSSDYIRLKSVNLGYNLPVLLAKRLRMSGARIFLNVDNAYNWFLDENFPGVNLESGLGNSAVDYITYPLARTYSLGFNVNF